jgi:hypothetical protein
VCLEVYWSEHISPILKLKALAHTNFLLDLFLDLIINKCLGDNHGIQCTKVDLSENDQLSVVHRQLLSDTIANMGHLIKRSLRNLALFGINVASQVSGKHASYMKDVVPHNRDSIFGEHRCLTISAVHHMQGKLHATTHNTKISDHWFSDLFSNCKTSTSGDRRFCLNPIKVPLW